MHEALVKAHLGEELIGHISRDGTAIEAREHPSRPEATATDVATMAHFSVLPVEGEHLLGGKFRGQVFLFDFSWLGRLARGKT